jgi:hypothetical protein
MHSIRRIATGLLVALAWALPASAQTTAAAATDSGPSLLWVWGWILVAGIFIMIVGTSLGAGTRR